MIRRSKVETILFDINNHKNYNLNKLIEERLEQTLNKYRDDLDAADERLRYKKLITVARSLYK